MLRVEAEHPSPDGHVVDRQGTGVQRVLSLADCGHYPLAFHERVLFRAHLAESVHIIAHLL